MKSLRMRWQYRMLGGKARVGQWKERRGFDVTICKQVIVNGYELLELLVQLCSEACEGMWK